VKDYPHIAIIDPRTGRLLWRKEGWTQVNPLTAEIFAETAMDFCSRNSFDRPPQAPRPAAGAAAGRPAKRPMHEMSEAEQLQAAMRASMEDVKGNVDDSGEVVYVDSDNDDGELDTKAEEDAKMPATPSLNDELLAMELPDEPADGARIQLRMPDGKRVVRKFATFDSVKMIYAFIAVSRVCVCFCMRPKSGVDSRFLTSCRCSFFDSQRSTRTKTLLTEKNSPRWQVSRPVI
jgi:hypothetical protein